MTKRILVVGDSPSTPTGFSTVILNIFKHFDKEEFEIHQLGINYYGDPHEVPWKLYPAAIRGDVWGLGRMKEFAEKSFDLIFILNDIWVINKYLEIIKSSYGEKKTPPIVVYFPVDSHSFDEDWFKEFDIVSKVVVYTKFGEEVCLKAKPGLELTVIPHGVDRESFYHVDLPKEDMKKAIFPKSPDFYDSFIVLNANRNQPRKRIDLTIDGFALFAEKKPENVKLYLHMGLKDAGVDILKMVRRYNIEDRLIITNRSTNTQAVPTKRLNLIYNATDVGINTSLGEGWGLVNVEHSVTGAPQVVPAHSACKELYEDCGLLVPINQWLTNIDFLTVSGIVKPEDIATQLQALYVEPDVYASLSKRGKNKFLSPEYDWVNISSRFQEVIKSCL